MIFPSNRSLFRPLTACAGTLLLAAVAALAAMRCDAGNITGKVRAEGREMPDGEAAGKYDSHKFKFVPKVDYEGMHDFVVYIDEDSVGTNKALPPRQPVQVTTQRISQKGAAFDPHVLPVLVGTTVEWPNRDDIYHNVFSFSEPKQFDLGLYKDSDPKKTSAKPVLFDKPGRVDVFCSIHTSMNCIVLVLKNPYFAATKDKPSYTIPNVPAGTYKLTAWHERMPPKTVQIVVPAEGTVKVDFVLSTKELPKY